MVVYFCSTVIKMKRGDVVDVTIRFANEWRRKNMNNRKRIMLDNIVIREPEHYNVPDFMYQVIKANVARAHTGRDAWEVMRKRTQYSLIVREIENGQYALVMGLRGYYILKGMKVEKVTVFVADVASRSEFMEKLKSVDVKKSYILVARKYFRNTDEALVQKEVEDILKNGIADKRVIVEKNNLVDAKISDESMPFYQAAFQTCVDRVEAVFR